MAMVSATCAYRVRVMARVSAQWRLVYLVAQWIRKVLQAHLSAAVHLIRVDLIILQESHDLRMRPHKGNVAAK